MRTLLVTHHGANAAEQQRAADHAGRGCGGGAEKRATRRHGRSRRRGRHRLRCLGSTLPSGRHGRRLARPDRGYRAATLALAEKALAYPAEKARIARRCLGRRHALELTDAGVSPFEGFVLHQNGLDQRIGGVGGLPQAIPDQALGLGIALGVLQRGQAVEQFDDEIAFLWGHWSPPSSLTTPVHVGNAGESGMTSIQKDFGGFSSPDQWDGLALRARQSALAELIVLHRRGPMNFRLGGVHSAAERAGGPPTASAVSAVLSVCSATK